MNDERELLELDRRWNDAYPSGDVAALDRILADDWVCIDGAGLVINKRQLLDRVKASQSFLEPYSFDDKVLRTFGDAAIVTGRLSGEGQDDEGRFYLEQRYTRVYVRRKEGWQAVATQVTVVRHERLAEMVAPVK